MSQNAVHRFILEPAERDPDGVALIDGPTGAETTRAQLAEGVMKAAGALAALGIRSEQRVMMVMADRPSFLEVFWGAIAHGAIPVPVSTMLPSKDYRFLIEDSRAVAVVVSDLFVDQVMPATTDQPFLEHVIREGPGQGGGPLPYESMRDRADHAPIFPADDEDIAFWLYTSGTTGFPKGAMHRHIDMGFLTEAYAEGVLEMTGDDRVYMVPKLFFAYGLGINYFALATGATHVLFDGRPTVPDVLDHVMRHRPTMFFGVPTFMAQLLASDVPEGAFSSVRVGITGGETLPADIYRRAKDELGLTVLDCVGSTELAHIYVCNRLDRQTPGSSGWAVEGFDVELRDDDGQVVPVGEPGQMYVAGESVTPGYWRRTEHNRRVFHGRFMATGDTFVQNDDESYTYLGRGDDMIKASGIWVSPAEVEAAIIELPEVVLAAVVGADDPEGLVKPKAFVMLAEGVTGDDALVVRIQDHVKSTLAPFKYPRWVAFVDELPTTATGKVKRHLLREG
ncbi:MAG: benzoate-CoA ligase family protein [Actinomycetota bacterium]|nr:benzoate-CoA ligase family protein [Actinomycetota bacterium]